MASMRNLSDGGTGFRLAIAAAALASLFAAAAAGNTPSPPAPGSDSPSIDAQKPADGAAQNGAGKGAEANKPGTVTDDRELVRKRMEICRQRPEVCMQSGEGHSSKRGSDDDPRGGVGRD